MTTQPQIQANRLNAQNRRSAEAESTGAKTPQGKAAASQNALKHGLAARHDVVITESQADFDLHREALLAELAPQGPTTPSPKNSGQTVLYKYIRIRLYTLRAFALI